MPPSGCSLVLKPEDDFSVLVMISICQNHSVNVFLAFLGNSCVYYLIHRVSTWALVPLPGCNFFFVNQYFSGCDVAWVQIVQKLNLTFRFWILTFG
jgi:hypothetical protein